MSPCIAPLFYHYSKSDARNGLPKKNIHRISLEPVIMKANASGTSVASPIFSSACFFGSPRRTGQPDAIDRSGRVCHNFFRAYQTAGNRAFGANGADGYSFNAHSEGVNGDCDDNSVSRN